MCRFGAMEVTVPSNTLSIDDTFVFLKEISSDGNVNALFVIYPTFPILYILAPDFIRYLIQPYLIYLDSGYWPKAYSVHDLGTSKFIPSATMEPKVHTSFRFSKRDRSQQWCIRGCLRGTNGRSIDYGLRIQACDW